MCSQCDRWAVCRRQATCAKATSDRRWTAGLRFCHTVLSQLARRPDVIEAYLRAPLMAVLIEEHIQVVTVLALKLALLS